jgi:hypothetical protein
VKPSKLASLLTWVGALSIGFFTAHKAESFVFSQFFRISLEEKAPGSSGSPWQVIVQPDNVIAWKGGTVRLPSGELLDQASSIWSKGWPGWRLEFDSYQLATQAIRGEWQLSLPRSDFADPPPTGDPSERETYHITIGAIPTAFPNLSAPKLLLPEAGDTIFNGESVPLKWDYRQYATKPSSLLFRVSAPFEESDLTNNIAIPGSVLDQPGGYSYGFGKSIDGDSLRVNFRGGNGFEWDFTAITQNEGVFPLPLEVTAGIVSPMQSFIRLSAFTGDEQTWSIAPSLQYVRLSAPLGLQLVPEPSALALVIFGAIPFTASRRSRGSRADSPR